MALKYIKTYFGEEEGTGWKNWRKQIRNINFNGIAEPEKSLNENRIRIRSSSSINFGLITFQHI